MSPNRTKHCVYGYNNYFNIVTEWRVFNLVNYSYFIPINLISKHLSLTLKALKRYMMNTLT